MNSIKRLADLLNIIMFSFCISIAGLFLVDGMNSVDMPVYYLLSGVFVIVLCVYCMRVFISRMPLFIVLHLVLIATALGCAVYFTDPLEKTCAFIWVATAFCMLLAGIFFWIGAVEDEKSMPVSETGEAIVGFRPVYKEGFHDLPLPFVILFALGMAFSLYVNAPLFGRIAYTMGILYTGLYLLRNYLNRMAVLMQNMNRETGSSQRRIAAFDAKIALPLIAFAIVVMFLFQSDTVIGLFERFLLWIVKGIARIAIGVFMWIGRFFLGSSGGGAPMDSAVFAPPADSPAWLKTFGKIVEYGFLGLTVCIVLYAIVRFVIMIARFYAHRSVNRVRKMTFSDMVEIRERIGRQDTRRKTGSRRGFFKTNAEKIRALYRNYVRSLKKAGLIIRENQTPLENAGALSEVSGRPLTEMVDITNLYDLARYGGREPDREDVVRMEKLI